MDREETIKVLDYHLYSVPKRLSDAIARAIDLLKDSISIEQMAEFLAEYAAPPQSLGLGFTKEEGKQAWIEFMRNGLRR